MTRRILAVDDMEFNRDHLRRVLEVEGHEVETAADGRSALERLRGKTFHLVITDLRMPDMSGLDLLSSLRAERIPVGVIVLTAYGDTADALRTMKAGADDFLTKPYDPDHLRFLVKRTLERRRLIDELEELRTQLREDYSFHTMVSKSSKMRRIFDLIEQVGPLGSTVLLLGETGTGKELVAQALHAASSRREGPFVALNCAVLNDSLLESELFGHEKGSFTGAERRKIGRFEQADGGTLLLDEVGDVAPAMQAKLLRVLQTGVFERVGGTESVKVDVRIIAATHKRLEDEVDAGRFRKDLFYRLNVIRLELPPLRERKEDIPLLATHFLRAVSVDLGDTRHRDRRRRDAGLASACVARQRPRAGERDQVGDRLRQRFVHPPREPSRDAVAPAATEAHGLCAHRHRQAASRPYRRPCRPGRARVLSADPLRVPRQRCAVRPSQRPVAAKRHPEASEIRSRAHPVQAAAR